MKFTILAPLLLSSTAFAGAGRWKRQDPSPTTTAPTTTTVAPSSTTSFEFTICRDERDCLAGERCFFQTLNGAHNGYNGICRPKNYSYVTPSPTPLPPRPTTANNLCASDNECRTDETCLTGNHYGEGGGPGGHCVSMQRDGPCSFNYNCQYTQYCDTGNGKCTDYKDCRGPEPICIPPVGGRGDCVPAQANATDLLSPDTPFVCDIILPSSSASSIAASSTISASSVVSSAAPVFVASPAAPVPAAASSSDAAPAPAQSQAAPQPEAEENKDDSAWRDEYRDRENARKYPINRRSKNFSA